MSEETLKIKIDSSEVDKGASSLDKLSASSGKAEGATDKLTSATALLGRAVSVAAGSYALFKASQYAQEALVLSQRYQELGIAMSQIGRNAGISRNELDITAKSLQKLGISMIESRQTVLSLVAANIDLANAEKLADLARNAAIVGQLNTSDALNSIVHGIRSGQIEVLRTIGINVSFEQSYAKLAKELGVSTTALSEQQKMQARMNIVLGESSKLTGLYEQAMGNAGKQFRSTERLAEDLKIKIGGLFDQSAIQAVSIYTDLLKDLDDQIDDMTKSGELEDWSHRIAIEFAGLADVTSVFVGQIGILYKLVSTQLGNIKSGNFQGLTIAFEQADKALIELYKNGQKYQDQVNRRVIAESMLTKEVDRESRATKNNTIENNQNTTVIDKAVAAKNRLTLAELRQSESTRATIELSRRVEQIIASVATKQEIYNQTLAELNRLKPNLPIEIYNRALQKAQEELKGTESQTRQTTDEVSQLWMQAGRNIQSALANSIFNFFDDGLKGMVKNVGIALGRIASEFAALKIAQTIGLSAMFAVPGAAAASGGGFGGTALNIAGLGSSALNLFKGGFGATSTLSGIGGMLPGQAGAFFGGMGGGTVAGVSSSAALAGSSFAAIAGPAIAIAAVDQITRMLAGDKLIGGGIGKVLNFVPVLGPLLNGLFGRGPMKQQGTLLSGEIGAEGFESGMLQTRFKAKGGLFRGDKIDFARIDAVTGQIFTDSNKLLDYANDLSKVGKELFGLINDTTKQTSSSLRQIGQNLGVSTEGIDSFRHSINLLSEKGKMLTEEQIGEEIQKITDGLAHSLIPQIDALAKRGETALQAVSRLGIEFGAINSAAIALGLSFADARTHAQSMGFELRTAFVDAAGGVDNFNQGIAFIAENFLTAEQKMAVKVDSLNASLNKLSIPLDTTKGEFYELLKASGAAGDAIKFGGLLDIAPLFIEITNASDALAVAAKSAAEATRQQAEAIRAAERRAFVGDRRAIELSGSKQIVGLKEQFADLAKEIFAIDKNYLYREFILPRVSFDPPQAFGFNDRAGFASESQRLQYDNVFSATARNFTESVDNALASINSGAVFSSIEGASAAVAHLQTALDGLKETAEQNSKIEAERLSVEKKIMDERLRLESQIFDMTASVAEKRANELELLSPSNRALQERIFALADEQKIIDETNAERERVLQERIGLETQLLQLQGDTAELRRRELISLSPSNRALQERIWMIESEANAVEMANKSADEAFSALERSVEAEKNKILTSNSAIESQRKTITDRYNLDLESQNDIISQFSDSINSLKGFSESLKSSITSTGSISLEAARSQIESAIKAGNFNIENVSRAVDVLSKTEASGFASAIEFKRAQAKNIQLLNELSISTDAQLTLEQRTLSALESARDRLTDNYNAQISLLDEQVKSNENELSRLDQIIVDAQTQINVLLGIDLSIIGVSSALAGLSSQIDAAAAAQASQVAVMQQSMILAQTSSAIVPENIASFDVGGRVPRTGLAMIHKNEQVLTADEAGSIDDKLAAISEAIKELTETVEVLTAASNKSKRIFEDWDGRGLPATRAA